MASRLKGRDYKTLRNELIQLAVEKAPQDWDTSNVADPLIIAIEELAMMGDQLHYYIDSLKRECDLATASLQSSVYSYALREGYHMILPKGSSIRVYLYPIESDTKLKLKLNKFDEFKIKNTNLSLFLRNDFEQVLESGADDYDIMQEVELVQGVVKTVNFTFEDIDYFSRIELPNAYIDGDMVELIVSTPENGVVKWTKVDDVVTTGLASTSYSLVPSFNQGSTKLYIEFPVNYRNLFPSSKAAFTFKYLVIENTTKQLNFELTSDTVDIKETVGYKLLTELGGYKTYESVDSIKRNYPLYTRDYTALLTKEDYRLYMQFRLTSKVIILDKSDEVFGDMQGLNERSIYVLSDLPYMARRTYQADLASRSSRSDMIWMVPFGYHYYTVFVLAKADLGSITSTSVETTITSALFSYYRSTTEVQIPIESVILHKIHESSPLITEAFACIYDLDSSLYKKIKEADEERPTDLTEVENTYKLLTDMFSSHGNSDFSYVKPNTLPEQVVFNTYEETMYAWNQKGEDYYDKESFDIEAAGTEDYKKHHYLIPYLYEVVVWVVSK